MARGIPVEENEFYDSELSGEEVEAANAHGGMNNGLTQEERDRQIAEQIMMMQMQEIDQEEIRRQHREQRKKQGPPGLNG